MTHDPTPRHEADELPRKPPGWPRWLWIVAVLLALLGTAGFVFLTAV